MTMPVLHNYYMGTCNYNIHDIKFQGSLSVYEFWHESYTQYGFMLSVAIDLYTNNL